MTNLGVDFVPLWVVGKVEGRLHVDGTASVF